MRQAPCQPNLLKFSNMCQRNYPVPSGIYLLPNPAVARLAPTNAPLAQMMSPGRGGLGASADKDLPQPTPHTFRHRRRHLDAVFLHQAREKRKEKRRGGGRSYGYECRPCAARTSSWPSPRSQVQPLRAILRNDTSSSQQHLAGVPGAPPGGATTPSSAAKSTDLTAATRSMRRQRRGKEDAPRRAHAARGGPRRGIARGHVGDGGHDADARGGRTRADRGLLSGCTLLRSAPEQPRTAKGATSRRRRQASGAASPRCCSAAPGPSWARRGAGEHLRDRVRLRPASPRMPF